MEEKDLEIIAEIEKEVFPHSGWNKQQYHYEISTNPVALPFVLTNGEDILGYYSIWEMFDYMTIATIAINPKYQGKGYGNILMEDIIKKSIELGKKSIDLEVRVSNTKAINLYKKYGFTFSHIRKGYYTNGEDAYFMIKKLGGVENEFDISD